MDRTEAMAYRVSAQQLDREPTEDPAIQARIFDLGVQDTGRDGASWALANRGFPVASPDALEANPEVALAWTLRSAPHYYRRAELLDVLTATSPLSEADATKRVFGAGAPLKAAGIATRHGLAEISTQLRAVVSEPMVKGDVSTALSARLTEPYLRDCRPCDAVHSWEVPFRVGALYAGLELEPGTSPPVLRPIPDWPPRTPGPAADPLAAPAHLQPIRAYLRLLGPATPQDVAAFLDAPVAEIKAHWPQDAVEVKVGEQRAWVLGESPSVPEDLVKLLGPYDLFLQARDRDRIVPDRSRHKALWPVIGRPGAVLSGLDIIGSWRPKASGKKFTLRLELWDTVRRGVRQRIEAEAGRLADHRGLRFAGIQDE